MLTKPMEGRVAQSGGVSKRRNRKLSRACWAKLEALEKRVMMSVYVVSSPNDDGGANELRWAINLANNDPAGGTITFSPTISSHTIALNPTLGPLELIDGINTDIIGTGITITGDGQAGLFNSYVGEQATISGLTFSQGTASRGGAIYNQGYLTLNNCTFTGDVANGNGGAIYNRGGQVTLVGCNLNTDSASSNGGAIDNELGNLTISNSSFTSDMAGSGGAILNSGTIYAINNCQINGDTASGSGGGLFNNGRIIQIYGATTFNNDLAHSTGGGLYNAGSVVVNNTSFTGDVGQSGGGGLENNGAGANAALTSDTFSGDQSNFDGGGVYNNGTINLTNTVIEGCTASSYGGGLKSDGVATFNNCLITGNQTYGLGGGIIDGPGDVMHINNSTLSFNVANAGGGLEDAGSTSLTNDKIYGNVSMSDGGGIRAVGSVLSVVGSTIFDNTALDNGGGIAVTSGISSVVSSYVYNNTSQQGSGGGLSLEGSQGTISSTSVFLNSAQYQGGGVYLVTSKNTVTNVNIYNNTAINSNGGGLYIGNGATLTSVQVNNNKAPNGRGGGMYSSSNVTISSGSSFSGDSAGYSGGGIFQSGGTLIATITLTGDTAGRSGGGLYSANYSTTLTKCTINGDGALTGEGGGIYARSTQVTLTGSLLQNDSAYSGAGGIYEIYGDLNLTNSLVQNDSLTNSSSSGAGAIALYGGVTAEIAGDTITGNSAPGGVGGLLDQSYNPVAVYNSILWNDTGGEIGGSSQPTILYSDVQNQANAANNVISADPAFVGNGSFKLLFHSPAVNTGSNALIPPQGAATDLAGNPRVADGTVDMGAYEAAIIVVDSRATGLNNGLSWANAYKSLSAALAAAVPGQIIEVGGPGPYSPGTTVSSTFQLVNGVSVYGGYAGFGASNPDARTATTVLTGAITGGGNVYHVVTASGVNSTAVLDGFTISGGNASGSGTNGEGAGIFDFGGSPTINNCIITNNSASLGGGVFVTGATLTISNSTITANTAANGSGIYEVSSTLNLNNCQIINSTATNTAGGVYVLSGTLNLTGSFFNGDSAPSNGGAIYLNSGVLNALNSVFVLDSISTGFGGSAIGLGGGTTSTLTNDTFTDDSLGGSGGGGIIMGQNISSLTVTNTIVWNDASYVNHGTGSEFNVTWGNYQSGTFIVGHSNIQGGFSGVLNINADPKFVAAPNATADTFGTLSVLPNSPVINTGINSAVPATLLTDIAGNPRITDVTVDIGAYEQPPVYVSSAAHGAANGTSWTNAYTSLASALTAVQNTETQYPGAQIAVEIGQGVYSPGSSPANTFQLQNNVSIYGGYAGYGTANQDLRNPTLYATTLSGGGVNYHVVSAGGTNSTALLDGVILTGGHANGGGNSSYGGGIFDIAGTPTLNNVIVSGNYAAAAGGGIYIGSSSSITMTNCVIDGNTTAATGSGGGFYVFNSVVSLSNCTLFGNSADIGGAMYLAGSNLTVSNSAINGNSALTGGGIYETGAATITRTSFNGDTAAAGAGAIDQASGSLSVSNSIFVGDSITTGFGGSALGLGGSGVTTVTNDTFTDDSLGGNGGGGVVMGQNISSLTVTNSIFWNDATYKNTGKGSEFNVTWGNYQSGTFTVSHCDVKGGFTGTLNINADPMFVRTPNLNSGDYGNLQLQTGSPAIGTGLNSANTSSVDFAGNPRVIPTSGTIDMGALENQATALTTLTGMVIGYDNADYAPNTVPDSLTVMLNQNAAQPSLALFTTNGTALPFQVTYANNQTYVLTFPSTLSSQYANNSLPAGNYMLEVGPTTGSLNSGTEYYLFSSPQTFNQTPTVVLAGSIPTVTTNSVQLPVIGNDPTGNHEPLNYTWTQISGPAQAVFSDPYNSGNPLTDRFSTVTATFSQAGTYVFGVTAADVFGTSSQLLITVVVKQTVASLTIQPASPVVANGQTDVLTATGADQFGNPVTPTSVTWAVQAGGIGGSVSPTTGNPTTYTAPATGIGQDVISATSGGFQTTTTLQVNNSGLLAPTGLIVTEAVYGEIDLQWDAPTNPNVASFNLYVSGDPTSIVAPNDLVASGITTNSYINYFTSDPSITTWYYEVTAVNGAGVESAPSQNASAVMPTGDSGEYPNAPQLEVDNYSGGYYGYDAARVQIKGDEQEQPAVGAPNGKDLVAFYGLNPGIVKGVNMTWGNWFFAANVDQLSSQYTVVGGSPYIDDQLHQALTDFLNGLWTGGQKDASGDPIISAAEIANGPQLSVLGYSWGAITASNFTRQLAQPNAHVAGYRSWSKQTGNVMHGGFDLQAPVPVQTLDTIDPVTAAFLGLSYILRNTGGPMANVVNFNNYYQKNPGDTQLSYFIDPNAIFYAGPGPTLGDFFTDSIFGFTGSKLSSAAQNTNQVRIDTTDANDWQGFDTGDGNNVIIPGLPIGIFVMVAGNQVQHDTIPLFTLWDVDRDFGAGENYL